MLKPKVPVALEGYPFIGFMAFVTIVLALIGWCVPALISLLLTAFVLSFFRDPERFIPDDEDALISPADGKIIVSKKVQDDTFTGGEAYKLSIFMNVFNVHVNRNPMSGIVERIMYQPGKFYAADTEKGELQNEYCATVMRTSTGHKIAFVQIAGLIARRIICWLENGDSIKKGERMGLIRFGSRVDLYLPVDAEIHVQMGQKVRAGETVLARLKESAD